MFLMKTQWTLRSNYSGQSVNSGLACNSKWQTNNSIKVKAVWWKKVLTACSWLTFSLKKKKKTSKSQTKAPHKMKLSETIMKTQPKEKYSPRDYTIWYNLNSPWICTHGITELTSISPLPKLENWLAWHEEALLLVLKQKSHLILSWDYNSTMCMGIQETATKIILSIRNIGMKWNRSVHTSRLNSGDL